VSAARNSVKNAGGIMIQRPSPETLETLKVKTWPVWEKEISEFNWHYDGREICFLLEGEAVVSTADGEVRFGQGDLVTFPKGLHCTWKIHKPVRKYYCFPPD